MRFWKHGAIATRAPTPGSRPAPPDGCATPFHPWSLLGTWQLEFQKPRRWTRLAAGGNAFSAKRTQIQNIPTLAIAVSYDDFRSEHKCETNPNERKTEGGRSLTPKRKDAKIQNKPWRLCVPAQAKPSPKDRCHPAPGVDAVFAKRSQMQNRFNNCNGSVL